MEVFGIQWLVDSYLNIHKALKLGASSFNNNKKNQLKLKSLIEGSFGSLLSY